MTFSKDACEVVVNVHEGTSTSKSRKIQRQQIVFGVLIIGEDGIIGEFHSKIKNMTSKAFILGKTFLVFEQVKKALCLLPTRFFSKVTIIEQVYDIEILRLDELMVSLKTFG